MKFGAIFSIVMFCAGAAFTLVDIGTDISLAYEYWNNSYIINGNEYEYVEFEGEYDYYSLSDRDYSTYSILTTVWIALGGLIQFLLMVNFLCRDDGILNCLPKSIQILLLFCSPILMAPVVVNLYATFFVFHNANDASLQDAILRLENFLFGQRSQRGDVL